MLTYKSLYSLVNEQIQKRINYNTTAPYTSNNQSSRNEVQPFMMPGSGRRDVTANELIEAMQALLDDALPNNIIEGLEVVATSPLSDSIVISAGKGTAGGVLYTLDVDVTISVPFDTDTAVFYVTLYKDMIRFDKKEDPKRLKLAKIVIPNPGTTNRVKDRREDEYPWDAYIVNFHKYELYGIYDTFEEDTIDLLRDNIGPILADNLIGNIRLSEQMTISNTAGTLFLDSQSVQIKDVDGNVLAKFNANGTFFYDENGIEVAKFGNDEARIGNIVIYPSSIQSGNFVSGSLGAGFQIKDSGDAEFNNIKARGKIITSVFEKDTVSSIGGNLLVSDSDILNADMTALDASTLTILGDTVFAIGDILRLKDGVEDEWLEVTSITSAPTYSVTRDKASVYTADNNPVWKKGTAVINYGVSGEGLIYMTASDTNSPHIDVITHAGAPWTSTTTRMRFGNVNGFLGALTDLYGIYIGEASQYLKYDPTNGLQIRGNVIITGGNAAVTYYQAVEPGSSGDPNVPKAGDYWIDTDNGNKMYTYQSSTWVEITSAGATTYYQGIEPGSSGDPNVPTTGDYWVDTNDNNKLYIYQTSFWVAITSAPLGTPSGSGLFLSADYMGYYNSPTWTTYIDKFGNFSLGDIAGGNTGISWSQASGLLTVQGRLDVRGANTGIYGYDDSNNNIFKLNCDGLCLIDAACSCNYSDLSAGALQFHDKLGTVPYLKRLASGVANTGCTVVLNGWTVEPQVLVSIKSLCSYASAQYAQNQKWDIFADNMTQYSISGDPTCYGYCFDVHATLTLASGTGSEAVKNIDFGACAVTEACTCISCLRFNFLYWCNDAAPANYYYGTLSYRVCYKEHGAGSWEGYCDYSYEQQHGSVSELKTASNTYALMTLPHMGCWDLMACCLSITWTDSTICSSVICCCCVDCTASTCNVGCRYIYSEGSHSHSYTDCICFGTAPSNVYCNCLCYTMVICYEASGATIYVDSYVCAYTSHINLYAQDYTPPSLLNCTVAVSGTTYCSYFTWNELLCIGPYTYSFATLGGYGVNCIANIHQIVCYCVLCGDAACCVSKNLCSLTNTYGCYCLLDPTGIVNWLAVSYS